MQLRGLTHTCFCLWVFLGLTWTAGPLPVSLGALIGVILGALFLRSQHYSQVLCELQNREHHQEVAAAHVLLVTLNRASDSASPERTVSVQQGWLLTLRVVNTHHRLGHDWGPVPTLCAGVQQRSPSLPAGAQDLSHAGATSSQPVGQRTPAVTTRTASKTCGLLASEMCSGTWNWWSWPKPVSQPVLPCHGLLFRLVGMVDELGGRTAPSAWEGNVAIPG